MILLHFTIAVITLMTPASSTADITGAWQTVRADGATGVAIFTDKHFSVAWYETEPAKFLSTEGGSWSLGTDGNLRMNYEFHTSTPELVGTDQSAATKLSGRTLSVGDTTWTRVDDGTPGKLEGAWLMTGARRDGEIRMRQPGARRTMKILSGTHFQWIAYNVETRAFSGSGGGTYTTENGRYTENIEFFSRDDTRSGMSLEFGYDLVDGAWHHDGKNSRGEPLFEIWAQRSDLGI